MPFPHPIETFRRILAEREPQLVQRSPGDREAAVAMVLRMTDHHLEMLMIKRAVRGSDPWSGHMALPGGRRQPEDADLVETALRETREETGITVGREAVIGRLDDVHPRSAHLPPIIVSPFVVIAPDDAVLHADPREVELILWVPVHALRDPAAVSELVMEMGDFSRRFPSIVYGEYTIWGLTHRILTQFLEMELRSSRNV